VQAIHDTVLADARALRATRGGAPAVLAGDPDATASACQADALAARVLGTVDEHGTVSWDRQASTAVTLTVVMDLPTLRGETDRFAILDGEPVPAGIGRDLADAATTWRRAVTAPVTGHLLDYGTTHYLPSPLRRYVLARDRRCRIPGCPQRAPSRLQLDHATPYPEGPSNTTNTGALCVRHHQLKTLGHLDLTHSSNDGSTTLTTRWGQSIDIPPHPYLHPPAVPSDQVSPTAPALPAPIDADPPPF
jgi:hypothetical protein